MFLRNKHNANIIFVGDNILADASEAGIYEKSFLLDNQYTCNAFINIKYMLNIRDSLDRNIYVYTTIKE